MANISVSGMSQVDLLALKTVVDAEIAARERYPDQAVSAVIDRALELHGCEIDVATARYVLSAKGSIDAKEEGA